MNSQFFMKMAGENIRKNWKMYLPFIISCVSTIMMTYIVMAISENTGLSQIPGGNNLQTILFMGYILLIVFSAVFLLYMHSFLMKNRKKEFGVYNILGMDKKHIMRMFTFEMFYVAVFSILIGLIAGSIFNKVCILLIRYMMDAPVSLGFEFSMTAVGWTVGVFTFIFILILLTNLFQIRLANPIELLKSGNVGEKEPKTKWILSIIGFILIAAGYYFALTIQSPIQGIMIAFLSILAVMAGTYLLFTTGSITVLKMLKANKNYYYKSNHFIPVSGMIYRMKKNAVGLANITVLSVCVIVLFSVAGAIFISSDSAVNTQYPSNFISEVRLPDDREDNGEEIKAELDEVIDRSSYETNLEVTDASSHAYLTVPVFEDRDGFNVTRDVYSVLGNQTPSNLYITDVDNYNQLTGSNVSLNDNEVFINGLNQEYEQETLSLMDESFNVTQMDDMEPFSIGSETVSEIGDLYYVIVPDMAVLRDIEIQQNEILGELSQSTIVFSQVSLEDGISKQEEIEFGERMETNMDSAGLDIINADTKVEAAGEMQALRSGLLFITLNLATLLLLMTVLIIYYKQTSEAYDDKERFSIMQKVGLDKSEIKRAINSQILTVFFLPLAVTFAHILAFSLLMKRSIVLVMLNEINLFPIAIISSFLIFIIIYILIYRVTARVYFNIVK